MLVSHNEGCFEIAENYLEGPSKGTPLKTCNEGVLYSEIENMQQTFTKILAAKLIIQK